MKYPVLIPAAGVGSRFGASIPKQYAQIAHAPVLQHTIDLFTQNPRIGQIAVIISPEDEWYDNCIKQPAQCNVYRVGGSSRTKSVANGLATLLQQQKISPNDTILVHDAARCCLPQAALNRLLDALPQCPDGAILAIPVADTLKSQDDNQRIVHTVPRAGLWQAQTPSQAVCTAPYKPPTWNTLPTKHRQWNAWVLRHSWLKATTAILNSRAPMTQLGQRFCCSKRSCWRKQKSSLHFLHSNQRKSS